MFKTDQAIVSAYGRADSVRFGHVLKFVLATIRMPLADVIPNMPKVLAGDRTRCIFGAKHDGLAYIDANHAALYAMCEMDMRSSMTVLEAENSIVHTLSEIPGLGAVKAGFAAQLLYGISGCLDSHNMVRFGIDKRKFRLWGLKNPVRKAAIINAYNSVCRALGGTEYLWDSWCEHLAKVDFGRYDSAEMVSRLHTAWLPKE